MKNNLLKIALILLCIVIIIRLFSFIADVINLQLMVPHFNSYNKSAYDTYQNLSRTLILINRLNNALFIFCFALISFWFYSFIKTKSPRSKFYNFKIASILLIISAGFSISNGIFWYSLFYENPNNWNIYSISTWNSILSNSGLLLFYLGLVIIGYSLFSILKNSSFRKDFKIKFNDNMNHG